MADAPDWATPAPDWARNTPAPSRAAKAAPAKAPTPKPAPQQSLLGRELSGLASTGSDLVSGAENLWGQFKGAIAAAPARRASAGKFIEAEQATDRAQRGGTGRGFADLGADTQRRFARNHMMRDAGRAVASDFSKPIDTSKGFIRGGVERAGKTGLDAVGAFFSPLSAGLTTLVGPEIQAVTGVQEKTAGNLLSAPAGNELGALARFAKGGRAAELGAGKGAARAAGETGQTDMRGGAYPKSPDAAAVAKARETKGPGGQPLGAPSEQFTARRGALGTAQKMFAPETRSEQARSTATLYRAAHGERRGEAAAENYALQRHQRVVANASPEKQAELANYVDTRSSAAPLSDSRMQPAADAMRGTANRYRARIENVLSDDVGGGPAFVRDYYARMWKNKPNEVEGALARPEMVGGKQGSGRNLKARSLPTYQEGLDAGLTPMFTNPLDAMNAYTDNMASFLATHDVQNGMKAQGYTKWAFEGSVPAGYSKLEGIRTTKPASIVEGGQLIPQRVLVAPDDVATVYNRTVSKGLDQGSFAPAYKGAKAVANASAQLNLGLSAFHGTVMTGEAVVSEVARGIKELSQGKLRGLGTIAASPLAPVRTALRGGKLRQEIMNPTGERGLPGKIADRVASPFTKSLDPKLAKMYTKAGGRVNMERFYNTSNVSGGFWRGIKNGTLVREVKDSLKAVGKNPVKGSLELAAKTLDTVGAPIFKEYIPRLKAGAWASQMEAFLKDNPEASLVDQQRFGENLNNSIDNRFGELIVDNQFWNKAHFQMGQLLMLSPSWNVGTVREIGGGLAELPASLKGLLKGEGVTTKTSYVAALAMTYTLMNGIATYMHTGQQPEGQDWLAYRTGGTDENGAPQRGMIPGYGKDVLEFAYNFPHNVLPTILGKGQPALKTGVDLINNEDHFGKPVYNPTGSVGEQLGDAGKFVVEQNTPISMKAKPKAPGDGFNTAENLAGIRQAPAFLENPERKEALDKKFGDRAWKGKVKGDTKRASRDAEAAPDTKPSAPDWASVKQDAPDWARGASVKAGATAGGDIRPEFKPVVDYMSNLPGVKQITGENDLYHRTGAHADGRGMDITLEGGRAAAPAFVKKYRQALLDKGYNVYVRDEYNNPSPGATAGHVHIQLNR